MEKMECYYNEIEIQFNENNEPIFWKVFNNKYLVHLIFQQIESINLESEEERIKFKDITSFKWMYKNQENELLKCKLEAGESITEIDKESLSHLFHLIFYKESYYESDNNKRENYFSEVGSYKMGDEYKEEDEIKEQDNEDKKEFQLKLSSFKKSFDLIVRFKPDQLIQLKVIDIIIDLGKGSGYYESTLEINKFVQNLLSIEPFNNSTELFGSKSIETAIEKFSPCILETLLNHCIKVNNLEQVITNEIKNKSIILAHDYYNFKEDMFEFILNEPKLFNSQPPSTLSLNSENNNNNNKNNNNKRLKTSKSTSPHSETPKEDSYKINISDFILIKSSSIQILLLQNNFVKLNEESNLSNKLKKQVFELLNGIKNDKSLDEMENRIKNIYIIHSEENNNYDQYFKKYGQVHEKMDDLSTWKNTMELKSSIGLKHLLSKDKKQLDQLSKKKKGISLNSKKCDEPFSISSETNEFIKYYTIGHQYFNFHRYDCQILNLVISCDQKDYDQLLKSIDITENNKFTNLLLLRKSIDNPINLQTLKDSKNFVIKDTNTIDLLSGCLDTFIQFEQQLKNKNSNHGIIFKFETFQLIDYAKSKYGSLFFLNKEDLSRSLVIADREDKKLDSYFNYPFTRAINNCDIESLKHIDEMVGIKFDKFQGCKSIDDMVYSEFVLEKIKQVKEIRKYSDKIKINFNYKGVECKENVIELLNYLNGSDYKLFSLNLFKKFINDITRLEFIDQSILKSIKFPTHFDQSDSLKLLLESISNNQVSSSKLIQLIIENFSPLSTKSSTIKPIIEKWESGYNMLFEHSNYRYISGVGEFEIMPQSSIYFVEDHIKEMFICESYQSIPDIITSIELILNQFSINYKNNKEDGGIFNLMVSKIINYLYKRLIKVSEVTIEQVLNNYQYIKSTWKSITGLEFQFQHSLYHVFFYLSIKSKTLIDLIFDCKQLAKNVDISGNFWFDNEAYNYESNTFYEGDNENEDGEDLSVVKALKPEIFTLDFIFNSTYKQVFNELKNILDQAITGNGVNEDDGSEDDGSEGDGSEDDGSEDDGSEDEEDEE